MTDAASLIPAVCAADGEESREGRPAGRMAWPASGAARANEECPPYILDIVEGPQQIQMLIVPHKRLGKLSAELR